MEDATDGEVYFDGKEVTHMSQHEFKKYADADADDFPGSICFSGSQNERFPADCRADPDLSSGQNKKELDEMVFQLMEEVGLAKRLANSYPHELDGGRRQRIGIARALSLNPEFIVCDEPVSALDVSIQAQILNLLMDLQEEKNLTYMFITHDMSVVKHISDDIAVMYLGQVVEKAEYQELFARPLHPYSQALFSAIPVIRSTTDRNESC